MPLRIEDYALIGDLHSAALVGRNGSIDWLCFPRFDSSACFAALLGGPEHGRWLLAPSGRVRRTRRRYRGETMVLETEFETDSGAVRVVDAMLPRTSEADLVRVVEGVSGEVPMRMQLIIRFDYGSVVPWVRRADGEDLVAVGGPDTLHLSTSVPTHGENLTTVAEFTLSEGQQIPFLLRWHPSYVTPPRAPDVFRSLHETEDWWREWSAKSPCKGRWREAVIRSALTLKALTYAPTGGIVAAPTSSLPEWLGGSRNWDYRYCWLRDATYTLYALMLAGYAEEAGCWRDWLLRAVAGTPSQVQAMYGLSGERRLTEFELEWLPGYGGSAPVRIGNAAYEQFQLDIYGEIMDAFHFARKAGLEPDEHAWRFQRALLDHLESKWQEPDEGIWEVRGPRRHFTHSKVMAWVAMDRAVKATERHGLDGPVARWRKLRDAIRADVLERGYDGGLNSFVQFYGSKELDASLLMLPLVGFLPANDPRMLGTVEAIQHGLMKDGFVARYAPVTGVDGIQEGEGCFLLCSFWLADNLTLQGRHEEAAEYFERLLAVRNDVGLLAEMYDPSGKRMLGNFPQAFSHVALINTAYNLMLKTGPAEQRSESEAEPLAPGRPSP
ncbi:MAG: glycoside hydrolase family 15 protein [Candidatus Tectomicrobia bacterium]|uniref:Trehalase n=1 Tax=Tectimicrobiota bacterium TaxID=2528274 RepID=A0A932MM47_UNCTE|nr:glycoside hydrolase family 15 protein [Candidatus Tectomicrobia bacterium]